jgi:hypothetical protein
LNDDLQGLNLYELCGIDGLVALGPGVVRKGLGFLQAGEQRLLLTGCGVDRFLARLLDADALDEVVRPFEIVGVLAVLLEEQHGGLERLLGGLDGDQQVQ